MDVMKAMEARRSVRSYLPDKVEQKKLDAVLEAVRLTPSRHNDQNIRVIVVRDSDLKKRIRQQAETQPMVEEADVLLVFCATDRTDFVMPCGQYGYVVDMFALDLFQFPVFNVADIFVVCGGIAFCIAFLLPNKSEARHDS